MEKPVKRTGDGERTVGLADIQWKHRHPRLAEHLTEVRWSDGSVRQASTITVFVESGAFKVALNDREGSCSLYRSGDSLAAAFESLEKALSAPEPDWRTWGGKRKK